MSAEPFAARTTDARLWRLAIGGLRTTEPGPLRMFQYTSERAVGQRCFLPKEQDTVFILSENAMASLDHIFDLRVLEALSRTGSLTTAARELGVAVPIASKRLRRLESALGRRLVDRSTRTAELTGEGEIFLVHCRAVLEAVDQAEEAVRGGAGGRIRITASSAFAQRQIAPRLPAFLRANPGVAVELDSSDAVVNLIEKGVDVAFRQKPPLPEDDEATVSPLAPDSLLLVASPGYLARRGTPATPRDLEGHDLLGVGFPAPVKWTLVQGSARAEVPIRGLLSGNDGEVAHAAALADGGIAMKSVWDVSDDIRAGRLVPVLAGWTTGPRHVAAILPMRDFRPDRIRRLVNYFRRELEEAVAAFPPALARTISR